MKHNTLLIDSTLVFIGNGSDDNKSSVCYSGVW